MFRKAEVIASAHKAVFSDNYEVFFKGARKKTARTPDGTVLVPQRAHLVLWPASYRWSKVRKRLDRIVVPNVILCFKQQRSGLRLELPPVSVSKHLWQAKRSHTGDARAQFMT